MKVSTFALVACVAVAVAGPALAKNFRYLQKVTLNVGQSVILKGVRHNDCGDRAPSWGHIKGGLPNSKTGTFSNGGKGTVNSNSCGGEVAARGVKFTAKKAGSERLKIYGDTVRITVK